MVSIDRNALGSFANRSGLLPYPDENMEDALHRHRAAIGSSEQPDETTEEAQAFDASAEHNRNALRVAAALLTIVGAMVVTESKTTAQVLYNSYETVANAMSPPSIPKPENATTIKIGDVIRYKDFKGKVHKSSVRVLSDISQAAQAVDPNLDTRTFNAMLASESHNSPESLHDGDAFTVDSSLGIEDLGTSAH